MAPERTEAIEHLATSYGQVAANLATVGEYLEHVVAWVRRGFVVLVITAAVLGAGIGYGVWNGYQGARARKHLLTQSDRIQRTSDEVHSAVTPGEPIYEAGQAQGAAVVSLLAAEQDCRTRRAFAHLPMPDPSKPCVDQTPAAVLNR